MAGQKMLKFVNVDRDMPEKRPPNLRNQDFQEIYAEYATAKAMSGLFVLVAQQEVKIRKDPVARTTALLQKVFSYLSQQA